MNNSDQPIPLEDYVRSLRKRNVSRSIANHNNRRASASEIEVMRSYLVKYYRKAIATRSYLDSDGQVWDCIPFELQPSLRGKKQNLLNKISDLPKLEGSIQNMARSESNECPDDCVPIRRVTLEEMINYTDLNTFFSKDSLSQRGLSDRSNTNAHGIRSDHKYAIGSQDILNLGADGILNVWHPRVTNNRQQMTLTQIWTSGGNGNQTQVIEVGWQIQPERFGNKPILFIFWTPDNYKTGSYNLETNAFVQTNNNYRIGGAFNSVSSPGGQQIEMRVTWLFKHGAWWLHINNDVVGYYHRKLFGNGILSRQSDTVIIGGEVAGKGFWPPMGSGEFADNGFSNSAYIRNVNYFDLNGNLNPIELQYTVGSPNCFNLIPENKPSWGTSFFFGGPGGSNC